MSVSARCAALAGIAALLAIARPAAAQARGTAAWTFHHERYTLVLPPGWWIADWRPGPIERRYARAKRPRAAATAPVVHFSDGRGNYFTVYVDHASDFEADEIWTVRPTRDGESVEIGAETPCQRGRGACSVGNGTLEIGTLPPVAFHGHRFTFVFGNTRREEGVDHDVYRWMIQEFRPR